MLRSALLCLVVVISVSCSAQSPVDPSGKPSLARLDLQFGSATFGNALPLQNNVPTIFSVGSGASVFFAALAIDQDGVYSDVTRLATLTSSNTGVGRLGSGSLLLTGAPGQVTVTATYGGQTASFTVAATTQARPSPAVVANLASINVGEDLAVFAFADGVGSLQASAVQWDTSNPRVISASKGTLHAHGPGTADVTVRYSSMQTTYRVSVPPYARLALVR